MTDWEKYAIIGTAAASAYLLFLKPKAKPKVLEYPPTYPPTSVYEPPLTIPPPTTPLIPSQIPSQIPPQQIPPQQIPPQQIIYKKEPIYTEREIPIPPKLISTPEQKVQQDINALTERRELQIRLKSLVEQRDKIKDEIIGMAI